MENTDATPDADPASDHRKRVYDIAEGLIRRGYSDADVRGVLGLNFKRMLEETWSPRALRGNASSAHVEPNANPARSPSLYTAADAGPSLGSFTRNEI